MDFIQRLIRYFAVVRKKAMRHRRLVTTCAAVVVFITAYALILPAITLDEETADQTPGISIEQSETTTEEKDAEATDASSTEEPDATTDETAKDGGSLITEPTTLSAEGAGYQATASVDGSAQLPASVALATSEVTESSDADAYKRYSDSALAQLRSQDSSVTGVSQARFFDVSFDDDGQEVEPQSEVGVTLSLDEAIPADSAEDVRVVHISDDGTASVLADDKVGVTVVDGKLSRVSFKSNRFSVYGVVVAEREAGDSQDSGTTDAQDDASDAQQLTHVLSASSDNYDVTISYDDDAGIPEGAKLSVDELSEGSDGYQAAKEAVLGSADADEGLGFVALDVTIRDADENIIEPSSGVAVSITAKGVPEDATSLEVRHIKDEDIVETVADATTGDVTLSDGTATASFDVDSFSTFTIRYYYGDATLSNIHVVDTSGKEIGTNKTYSMGKDTSVGLSTVASEANPDSSQWRFVRASVGSYNSKNSVTNGNFTYAYYGESYNWRLNDTDTNNYYTVTNQSVYLVYQRTDGNVTLSFDTNGGSGSVDSITTRAGSTVTLPDYTGTRDGYTFLGWTTDSSQFRYGDSLPGTTYHPIYAAGTSYTMPEGDTTLYAAWSPTTPNRTANFYIRLDGTIPSEPDKYPNSAYTAGISIANDLKTLRWVVDNDTTKPIANNGSGNYVVNDVTDNLNTMPTNNQLMSAINAKSSDIGFTVKIEDDELVIDQITDSSKAGDKKAGDRLYVLWYVQKLQDMDSSKDADDTKGTWHIDGTLLVKSKISVSYDGNPPAGAGTASNVSLGYQENKDTVITVGASGSKNGEQQTPVLPGYTFLGWTKNTRTYDGTQKLYQNGEDYTLRETTTFYAQWTKGKNLITVKKTDEAGTVLSGATFKLYEGNGDGATWTERTEGKTSDAGTYTFRNVDSQTVYRMDETYAPNGYETRNSFYFKVTTGENDQILSLYETDAYGNTLDESATHNWVVPSYDSTSTSGGVGAFTITIKDEQIKRKVVFVKTAADRKTRLGGATFSLKKEDGTAVTGVLNGENGTGTSGSDSTSESLGVFSATNATLPYGTYTLTETQAPSGYVVTKPITITLNDPSGKAATTDGSYITDTGMTFSGDGASDASVSMTRTTSGEDNMATTTYTYTVTVKDHPTTDVTVIKTDNKTPATNLGGVTFKLEKLGSDGKTYSAFKTNETSNAGEFSISEEQKNNGIKLTGLSDGTYQLTETKAPDGYVIANSPITFVVDAEGNVTVPNGGNAAVAAKSTGDTTLTITNTPGRALPETGGSGSLPFLLGGSALITLAIVGYALRRRSEGGDARS